MTWEFNSKLKKAPATKDAVLIVGMPGIGNVGKVTADFIIDELKAKLLYDIFSYDMPNSVFVNEKNLVELPKIEMFYKKRDSKGDIIILTGDVQPPEERSSYEFCENVLEVAKLHDVKHIITLGGIGLAETPKKPHIFCTGNSQKYVKDIVKGTSADHKLFGVVGPIIGVSGLLVGLADRHGLDAACLLAETLGHPAYIGVRGAKELLKVLNKRFKLSINIKDLDKEIEEIEDEIMNRTQELGKISNKSLKKIQSMQKETSYIG